MLILSLFNTHTPPIMHTYRRGKVIIRQEKYIKLGSLNVSRRAVKRPGILN